MATSPTAAASFKVTHKPPKAKAKGKSAKRRGKTEPVRDD